jgi:hypothetical protein
MTLPFTASYAVLCLAQGAAVVAPGAGRFPALSRLGSPWWAAIPAAAIVGTVLAVGSTAEAADALTYLALVTTPPLAAMALGYAGHGARPWLALLAVPASVAAWLLRGNLIGEAASLLLVAGACVTLASLLTAVAPARWLKAGLLLMAAVDTALVVENLLQAPNAVLNAAAPGGGLPQFQRIEFGSAVMGYGDLFAAALLGALLAERRSRQLGAAALTAVFALAFGLLFLVIDTLPATVPVAAALIVSEAMDRSRPKLGSNVRPVHG